MLFNKVIASVSEYFSRSYWLNVILTRNTLESAFSVLGKIWFVITVLSLFVPNIKPYISQHPYPLISITVLILVWAARPKLSVRSSVKNCDIHIEIKVGNMFDFDGVYVIGTNTTFDTDIENGLISKNSLQGQVSSRFYTSQIGELDADLERSLDELDFDELDGDRAGKTRRYPLGTVIRLKKGTKVFYWVAIANFNKQGSIESVSFDDLQASILKLWKKIEIAGNIEPVIMPLLGSSRCRIQKSRTEFAKAVIDSFIFSCREKRLCEKLVIVISPQDYIKYSIDLRHLEDYLNCRCEFPELISKTEKVLNMLSESHNNSVPDNNLSDRLKNKVY